MPFFVEGHSLSVPPTSTDLSVFMWIWRGMYRCTGTMLHYTEECERRFSDQILRCKLHIVISVSVRYIIFYACVAPAHFELLQSIGTYIHIILKSAGKIRILFRKNTDRIFMRLEALFFDRLTTINSALALAI